MVKTVLSLTLLGTLLTTSVAQAATADSVRTSLMTATGLIADAVEPSPVKGIWEVQIQGRIFYVDDEAKYVLAGANIIETATQKNLTNERLREIARENWSKWPLKDAVKQVYGKGERQIVVFSDANCQYCRAMESVWEQVGNLTVYTFITPLIRGGKDQPRNRVLERSVRRLARLDGRGQDARSGAHDVRQERFGPESSDGPQARHHRGAHVLLPERGPHDGGHVGQPARKAAHRDGGKLIPQGQNPKEEGAFRPLYFWVGASHSLASSGRRPFGISTQARASLFWRPALAPASSPNPQK